MKNIHALLSMCQLDSEKYFLHLIQNYITLLGLNWVINRHDFKILGAFATENIKNLTQVQHYTYTCQ